MALWALYSCMIRLSITLEGHTKEKGNTKQVTDAERKSLATLVTALKKRGLAERVKQIILKYKYFKKIFQIFGKAVISVDLSIETQEVTMLLEMISLKISNKIVF